MPLPFILACTAGILGIPPNNSIADTSVGLSPSTDCKVDTTFLFNDELQLHTN